MRQVVNFHYYEREDVLLVHEDKYSFKPKGKLSFLQKIAFRWLARQGTLTNATEEKAEYKRISIDKQKVWEKCLEGVNADYPRARPSKIYMGPDELEEIMDDPETMDMIGVHTFNLEIPIYYSVSKGFDRQSYRKMLGLDLIVVPYMEGVLVV